MSSFSLSHFEMETRPQFWVRKVFLFIGIDSVTLFEHSIYPVCASRGYFVLLMCWADEAQRLGSDLGCQIGLN
jgi:hypothetical protein